MRKFNKAQFVAVIRRILELRADGLSFKEIDVELCLVRRSYRIMQGKRAKAVRKMLKIA